MTLWLCVLNSQHLYKTFLAPCPGPVLQPEPRKTPWCKSFAKELAKEVETFDAASVRKYTGIVADTCQVNLDFLWFAVEESAGRK